LVHDLKVALISPEFPPFSLGGISAVCHDLAWNLSKKGVHTTVFCGKSNKMTIENVNNYLKVVRLPLLDLLPRHVWFQLQNTTSLMSLLKGFDVIHTVDPKEAMLAYFSKNLHTPFVTHVHGSAYGETEVFLKSPISCWTPGDFVYAVLEYPMNEYLINKCMQNSDHLVVCSNDRFDEMKRRNSNLDFAKVSVIYNGIDFDRISHENSTDQEKENSVLFWGRLYYNKGIIQLIKAMAIVKQSFPNVHLDVCGKGPLEAKIRSLTHKLCLDDNVTVHGYIKNEVLIEKIKSATVVALPSLYEGQPMAALEAMAYKKSVVMYDFPFAREYINDWENGLIAKREDIKDLASRISTALLDKKLRQKLGQNAYERVRKNHNWETLIYKYIDLYTNLMQKGT
jgi:glycosyltransferase involved in cell wall biosynthesis